MRRIKAALITWGLMLFAPMSVPAQQGSPQLAAPDHSALDKILRDNVRDEKIDYHNIRRHHRDQLDGYLDQLAATDVKALPRREQLAFYINLYNATAIRAVTERLKEGYSVADEDFALFKESLARLKDGAISLNDLEHKIIRPTFKDPRVHTALVCGARSCPPLLPRAYDAGDLDAVLDNNMRRFVNDPTRNRLDAANKTLLLSRIFDWYADDFGGKTKITEYVARFSSTPISRMNTRFLEYDWDLNIAPGKDTAESYRGILGPGSSKIRTEDGKTYLWAGGEPSGPQARWYDFTGAPLRAADLQFGIGKDTIRAIDDPLFVSPDDPRLIKLPHSPYRPSERPETTDDIMVIGVTDGDHAWAYPTALLDHHELVNYSIGGMPVTVGW